MHHALRIYAQTPARRTRQILADLLAVAVIAAAVRIALAVHSAIMRLAEPGRVTQSAGDRLAGGLGDAGNAADRVPLIGGALKQPLEAAASAGNDLAQAGQAVQDAVGHLAFLVTAVLIAVPVLVVLAFWTATRLRWIIRSAAARRLLEAPDGADLFALRALTGPLRDLAAVEAPPAGLADGWRRGDPAVISALSRVGLAQVGLRP